MTLNDLEWEWLFNQVTAKCINDRLCTLLCCWHGILRTLQYAEYTHRDDRLTNAAASLRPIQQTNNKHKYMYS